MFGLHFSRPRRRSSPDALSASVEALEDRTLLSATDLSALVGPPVIIDNGDAGFSQGSNWGTSFNGGFGGDHEYNAAGTGTDTAEWTFSVTPGRYQVAVTWLPGLNRATNAPFSVLDGANVLTTVTVDQEAAPGDFTADGTDWKNLGEFVVTGNTLTVQLSDAADEFVIADAVRIVEVFSGPDVDATVDGHNLDDGGSVDFGETLVGSTLSKTVTVTNSGDSDLVLNEPISVPNGFSLAQSFGSTTLAAGESTTFVLQFDASAVGIYSGQVSFGSNDMDETPFSFTVNATVSDALIIDNGDPGFSLGGSDWGVSTNGGFGGDHSYNLAGTGGDTAEWTFAVGPGDYEVSTTWLEGLNRATDATFTILDGTTVVGTVVLNQELAPDDFTADGADWEMLGTFTINSGTLTVRLTDAADEFVIADAVRVAPANSNTGGGGTGDGGTGGTGDGGTTDGGTGDGGTGDGGTGDGGSGDTGTDDGGSDDGGSGDGGSGDGGAGDGSDTGDTDDGDGGTDDGSDDSGDDDDDGDGGADDGSDNDGDDGDDDGTDETASEVRGRRRFWRRRSVRVVLPIIRNWFSERSTATRLGRQIFAALRNGRR